MDLSRIELLAAFAATAGVWMCGVTHLRNMIRGLVLQTAILGLIALLHGQQIHATQYIVLAGFVIAIKAVAIPLFLAWTANRVDVWRDKCVSISPSLTLLAGCGVLAVAYMLTPYIQGPLTENPVAAGMALALLLTGMLLMITRRIAISQIIGFLVLENGIFLYALTQTHGMPLIIEMGVVFDVLIGVMVAGLVIFRLNRSFEHIDVTKLRGLKG